MLSPAGDVPEVCALGPPMKSAAVWTRGVGQSVAPSTPSRLRKCLIPSTYSKRGCRVPPFHAPVFACGVVELEDRPLGAASEEDEVDP